MFQPITASQRFTRSERRLRAVELRKAGLTLEQIACQLNSSKSTIDRDLKRTLHEIHTQTQDAIQDMRDLENIRLESLLRSVWPKAIAGHLGALDTALKIHEKIVKLNGLRINPEDRPRQQQPVPEPDMTLDELDVRITDILEDAKHRQSKAEGAQQSVEKQS